MKIIGIDPGANTGVAFFGDGKLQELCTIQPWQIVDLIAKRFDAVYFEDSRLESHIWTSHPSKAAAMKMARNVGEIDAWCTLIEFICKKHSVYCAGLSPKEKGAKMNAASFKELTKWGKSSNQHERDAAMVAWRFRNQCL